MPRGTIVATWQGHGMRYSISGRQLNIGDALKQHVNGNLEHVVSRFAERPTHASTVFAKNGQDIECEIIIHLSTGLSVQSKSSSQDIYQSFDKSCDRITKQLRRYKRRLKNHHKTRSAPVESSVASAYILAAEEDGGDREVEEPETLQPVIIAETETRVPLLSVGEAVMQMELAGASVLVFRNERNDGINVVYRRDDGNIGWIEPDVARENSGSGG